MSRRKRAKDKNPLLDFRRGQAEPQPATKDESGKRPVWLLPTLAVALVLVSGVVHGLQSNRWLNSRDVEEAAARLENVPLEFGDWKGTDLPIDEAQMKQAGAVAWVHRVYEHKISRKKVNVMLLCGSHGPISLHPPTVCFTSAGWALEDAPKPTAVLDKDEKSQLGQFFVCRFRRDATTHDARMRTCWAWNANGDWESPDRPRFAFSGAGHLYKAYVSVPLTAVAKGTPTKAKEEFDQGTCAEFLRAFLPVLKKAGI